MEIRMLIVVILTVPILRCNRSVVAAQSCPDCGKTLVPYPFSTATGCGDPLYKIRCNAGTLWLDTFNGSTYKITSINQATQRMIILPSGFVKDSCVSADLYRTSGVQLDPNGPFNITSSNTVMIMNCTDYAVTQIFVSLNCTSTSVCHDYIGENPTARAACGATRNCCWFRTGGSLNSYRIRVHDKCRAYQSFVNLDMGLPVSKWPEPGVELEWALPQEPVCKMPVDCQNLVNSVCLLDPGSGGQRRCFCRAGFKWDPINGVCQGDKCPSGKHCNSRKKITPLIVGTVLSACAMLLGILTTALVYKRSYQNKRESFAESSSSKIRERILTASNSGLMGRIFSSKEIIKATDNFSKDKLLGSGGFGEVFKGVVDGGTMIAIKRAKVGSTKGSDQILNEVQILCQVNHKNLVRLLGYCVEFEQPLLVYEYILNGTLFHHLHHSNSDQRTKLTWHRRLVIAYQTAEGLAYLHSSATTPIYHRDVKSSNILLDDKLDAKISDFGLSRLVLNETSHVTTCAQGTLGYLDPEYYLNFQLTDKSDVYSFGVVLSELLTSKKAIDFNRKEGEVNLVVYIRKILQEERLLDAIDPDLKRGASKLELETMKAITSLATACLDEKRQNRPTMKEAANEIEYIISLITAAVPEK